MPITQHELGGCSKSFATSAKPAWPTFEILSQRILGQLDGSSGKGTCYQACQPEVNFQNPHRRKEPILNSCLLTSTHAMAPECPYMQTHKVHTHRSN